jgi:hypothetical protein
LEIEIINLFGTRIVTILYFTKSEKYNTFTTSSEIFFSSNQRMTKYSSTETSNSNIYSSVMFLKKCNPNFEAIEIKSLQNQNSSESTLLRVRSGGAGFGCCTGCLVCVIMSDSPNLLGPIESLLMVLLD